MADPKLLLILKEIETRLENINGISPYFSRIGNDVQRGRRVWNPDDLPACSVFLTSRGLDQAIYDRAAMAATVTIEGRMALTREQVPEDWGVYMLADIQTAIETTDRNLSGKLIKTIVWESDSIAYPDSDVSAIAAQVVYSIPHIRPYGDPY